MTFREYLEEQGKLEEYSLVKHIVYLRPKGMAALRKVQEFLSGLKKDRERARALFDYKVKGSDYIVVKPYNLDDKDSVLRFAKINNIEADFIPG